MSGHSFENFQNVFLFYKRHFAVNLGKFWLTVCTQIFVTETFYDLEISIHSTNHQELFESLWRLWQCIKLSLIHSTWYYEISRSFWRRFYQNWSFYLNETFV